jgi:hypothetical protein
MANISLTVENALSKLQLENQPNVGAFKCSKFAQEGIIVISDNIINFAYQAGEEELKFEKFNFPLIQGIFIPRENDGSPEVTVAGMLHKKYIDIMYGQLKIRFHFFQMQDFLKAGNMLETLLPDKIQDFEMVDPPPKKKLIKANSESHDEKDDFLEIEPDAKARLNMLPNTAKVSDKFMRVASNTVMNYKVANLKPRPEPKDKPKADKIPGINNRGKTAIPPENTPLNNPTENQGVKTPEPLTSPVARPESQMPLNQNRIPPKKDLSQMHQHAKVSEKFMKVANDTIRSETIVLKASPIKNPFNFKKFFLNVVYLVLILIFFKSSYSKPVRDWAYKVYKQPDKISYFTNMFQIERCEVQMTSIGKILLSPFKTNSSFPPDIKSYINKSFPDGDKKDYATDPWGKTFIFEKEESSFRIISSGPDKKQGTKDDIKKVFNIGYDPSKLK